MRGIGEIVFATVLWCLSWTVAGAQSPFETVAPRHNPTTAEKVALGKFLFESPLLSDDGKISCATCHDPARSFVDGRADSRGMLAIGIGRNSPTMFAIGLIDRFRDPAQAQSARRGRKPKVLSLEDRCLAPMENELEMGKSVKTAVATLRKTPGMKDRFRQAFGGGGVSKKRLGQALAAFVRTLEPPRTAPYRRYLEGDQGALSAAARRGLDVFQGRGRCDTCHAGPALSDGLMHVADPPLGQRIRDRERAAMTRHIELLRRDYAKKSPEELGKMSLEDLANEAQHKADMLPGGGGYDPSQIEVQTPVLWDVARTGPYFRDGSVRTLRETVKIHVDELRYVMGNPAEVKEALKKVTKVGKQAARSLRPDKKKRRTEAMTPGALSKQDVADLVAFLRSLSPK